ncbi:MAG: alkyl/aryl-sulfatase [Syntrophobacteraceae bacterium]
MTNLTGKSLSPDTNTDGHVAATPITAATNAAAGARLPLDDTAQFEDALRGFIAKDDPLVMTSGSGREVWNMPAYDFLEGAAPPSVNPSLWRQAKLNNLHGIFEVTERIYQVRGYDLANMSVIEGDSGRILVDPLTAEETAARALALVNRTLGERPLSAVIFTHSHLDHFGGIKAVTTPEDVRSGRVRIVAPKNFLAEAVSENVIAGVVMGRRAHYMYGEGLGRTPRGHVDTGLGKGAALGSVSILTPTDSIDRTGRQMTIDGIEFIFQYAPHSEAPAELTFFLPQLKAFCGAEIVSQTMHNLYTLRGAKVRDALLWSGYIDEAIDLFGDKTEVVFNCHHWPVWGQERITDYLKKQRDTYRYLHDQTLRMASCGMTPREIAEEMTLPESLRSSFPNRGYYGTARHNARAVYQFYFGWFDGNPANLDPLPPEEEARRYVEAMGGIDAVLARARAAYDTGDYRWAATLLDHAVFAAPGHDEAKALLACVYDQLGYQAESGPWRDIYLTGACELRRGVLPQPPLAGARDILENVPLSQFFTAMATRLNGPRANGAKLTVNFVFKDLGAIIVVRLENSVLHHKEAPRARDADATVTLTRAFWIRLLTGQVSLNEPAGPEDFSIEGDPRKLAALFSLFDAPDNNFPIVTP